MWDLVSLLDPEHSPSDPDEDDGDYGLVSATYFSTYSCHMLQGQCDTTLISFHALSH